MKVLAISLGCLILCGGARYRPLPLSLQPDLARVPDLTAPASQYWLPGLAPHPVPHNGLDEISVIRLTHCEPAPPRDRGVEPGAAQPGIRLDAVWLRYPGATGWALRNVCCQFSGGEVMAVTGSTGSGKSTLVSLLPALLLPTRGTVRIAGMTRLASTGSDMKSPSSRRRRCCSPGACAII